MFTIDLLKGQGIPIKRKPWGAAIAAMAFAVPILVAMVMLGFYLSDRIVIRVARQEITNCERNIEALADVVELQRSFEAEKNNVNNCLSEASSFLGRHTQWSPVLATVVENMPPSMILTRIEVKQRSINKTVPKKEDPNKTSTISVPVNSLQMSIIGRQQSNTDKAVKDFKDNLRLSALLAPRIEDIVISQKSDTFDGQDVISYNIDCIFKP